MILKNHRNLLWFASKIMQSLQGYFESNIRLIKKCIHLYLLYVNFLPKVKLFVFKSHVYNQLLRSMTKQ